MSANRTDVDALLLDQNYFELDAQGYSTFQRMVDNPPAPTDCLRCALTSQAPWGATPAVTDRNPDQTDAALSPATVSASLTQMHGTGELQFPRQAAAPVHIGPGRGRRGTQR